jgi:UDPglucose--hexose-1-phosphate uridylyltransferase
MPELRPNYFTTEWVIRVPERAKRPAELVTHRTLKAPARYVETCPFLPGNENKTPPEVMRVPSGTTWQVRVVANKFAAFSPDIKPTRIIHRSRRSRGGFGSHDVIVESPNHADVTCLRAEPHIVEVLPAYKARYDTLSLDRRIAHITIFKNHGKDAGASLEHPHSQLIAAPVISRFQQALNHYDEYGECMFCQVVQEEFGEGKRLVIATDHFVALQQFASPTPFCMHIYPRRHMASFGDINSEEIGDLAGMANYSREALHRAARSRFQLHHPHGAR